MSQREESLMVVAGTRPEIIKLAPLIEALDKFGEDYVFIWSGQHYDYELSKVFFKEFRLPNPDIDLGVGSSSHAGQVAETMIRFEKVILKYNPSIVVALGDTNTVVAIALTSVKLGIPFAHIEAGLRSYDMTMPEEVNRKLADAIATICFAPTELAAINLMHEGVSRNKIYVTGNTIVDMVLRYKDEAYKRGLEFIGKLGLEPGNFLLATIHRQENTDDHGRLLNIIKGLIELSKHYTIVLPAHPRTINRLKQYGIHDKVVNTKNIILLNPLGYLNFLGLLIHARVVLTDSGGVQEEAFTLKIPTVTLRYNTERPETVLFGGNTIVGTEANEIVSKTLEKAKKHSEIIKKLEKTPNPLGDGEAGMRIAKILKEVNGKIRIEEFDSREDPYITYAVIDKVSDINEEYVVSYYNGEYAIADGRRANKALIKASLNYIRKLLENK